MNIVTGSGNRRKVFEFPAAEIVHHSPINQQVAAKELLCNMLKIPLENAA